MSREIVKIQMGFCMMESSKKVMDIIMELTSTNQHCLFALFPGKLMKLKQ